MRSFRRVWRDEYSASKINSEKKGSEQELLKIDVSCGSNRNRIIACNILFAHAVILFAFACGPYYSSMSLTVSDKIFSDALIMIDGKKEGHFKQSVANRFGEMFVNGNKIGQTNDRQTMKYLAPMTDEFYYAGGMQTSLKPGLYKIDFVAKDGSRLEVEANIPPGEH
jgi:hypothetical protein